MIVNSPIQAFTYFTCSMDVYNSVPAMNWTYTYILHENVLG